MSCEHPLDIPPTHIILNGCGCALIRVSSDYCVYSYEKLVDHFHKHGSMTFEEARDWVDFNILGVSIPNWPYIALDDEDAEETEE